MIIMNELKGTKVYVILSVKEGEGFGFLQESCVVSCSLNGHTLQTDPCGIRSSPIFDSELIWETDKKTLRSLRLQNIPIKIQITTVTGKKVGYLLLNLLTASPCPAKKPPIVGHSWHKLLGLSGDAKSSEPKLLLRLIVSDSDKPNKNVDPPPPELPKVLALPLKTYFDVTPSERSHSVKTTPRQEYSVENDQQDGESKNLDSKSKLSHQVDISSEKNLEMKQVYEEKSESDSNSDQQSIVKEHKVKNVKIIQSNYMRNEKCATELAKHRKTPKVISLDSSVMSDTRESHSDKLSVNSNILHAQGDTPLKHTRRGRLPTRTKEELIRKTVSALEKWKEKQQIIYTDRLQQSEKFLLQRLEDEWKQREWEQRKLMEDCRSLVQTLQKSLTDVNQRSDLLTLKENKLRLAKDELEMLYMSKYHELNEAAKRMEDDFNHQTKLQHITLSQLESKMKSLEDSNELYKNRLQAAENELDNLKRNAPSKDDLDNQKHEKACLEKQLEAALKSKAYFKDQWVSAIREANVMKLKYSTNLSLQPTEHINTYRMEELLQNEASILRLDSAVLKKLKDDIIHSERSESQITEYRLGSRELLPKLDIASPSKKSVS